MGVIRCLMSGVGLRSFADPGLLGGAGRRTPCAERAVILPAVQSLRRSCGESGVRSLVVPGLWGEAGRRTPCAGRAVMLTAVQSLRLSGAKRARVQSLAFPGRGGRGAAGRRWVGKATGGTGEPFRLKRGQTIVWGDYLAGGRMTESMTWMTPLLPTMSVVTTLAPAMVTPPSVAILAEAPLTVFTSPALTSLASTLPATTW